MKRRPRHIVQGGGDLMPRQGLFRSRIDPAAALPAVGRITDDLVHGFRFQKTAYPPQVSLDNLHAVLKTILSDILSGQPGRSALQLQTDDAQRMGRGMPEIENQPDNPAAGTEVKDRVPGRRPAEMGQQQTIDGKAISLFRLSAAESAVKERIAGYRAFARQASELFARQTAGFSHRLPVY